MCVFNSILSLLVSFYTAPTFAYVTPSLVICSVQRLTSKKMIWSMESMVKGSTAGHIHIRPTCFSITSGVSMWNSPHGQSYGKSEIVLPHSLLCSHLHSTLRLSRLAVIEVEGDWFDLSWLSFLYISLLLMYFFLPSLQSLPLASSSTPPLTPHHFSITFTFVRVPTREVFCKSASKKHSIVECGMQSA